MSSQTEPPEGAASSPPNDAGREPDLPERIDRIARKYFQVWIWSVVVGVATTNSMSLISHRPSSRGYSAALLTAPLIAFSAFFTVFAWYATLRYFTANILPTFFHDKSPEPGTTGLLKAAVEATILAVVSNVILNVVDQFLLF